MTEGLSITTTVSLDPAEGWKSIKLLEQVMPELKQQIKVAEQA